MSDTTLWYTIKKYGQIWYHTPCTINTRVLRMKSHFSDDQKDHVSCIEASHDSIERFISSFSLKDKKVIGEG